MNVLVLNLACDRNYAPLAFVEDWVAEIAARADRVVVITNRLGEFSTPANVVVRSLGGEEDAPDWLRLWRLWTYAWQAIRRDGCKVCFAHMTPKFATLVAPLCRAAGVPIVLWYAHNRVGTWLRTAVAASTVCVTPVARTLQIASPKRRTIGHGITLPRVPPRSKTAEAPLTIVHLGRIASAKRLDVLIKAFALLPPDVRGTARIRFVGDPVLPEDDAYLAGLHELGASLGVGQQIDFRPALPFDRIGEAYADAAIAFNGMDSIDKSALEAMATGLPCVLLSPGFLEALGEDVRPLLAEPPSPEEVATILRRLIAGGVKGRVELGHRLRDIVTDRHSVRALMDRLFLVFESITSRPQTSVGGSGK